MKEQEVAPRWDMSTVFPSIGSQEFSTAKDRLGEQLSRLVELYDSVGVRQLGAGETPTPEQLEIVLNETNGYLEALRPISVYVHTHVTVDSRDELAQAAQSELLRLSSTFTKLSARFSAWIGAADVDAACASSEVLNEHRHFLERAKVVSLHQMSPAEEELYADLGPSAGGAWGRLHGNVTSVIEVEVPLPDGAQRMTMSQVRTLAYSQDRAVRKAAYESELEGWQKVAIPLAGAMNSIKGEVGVVAKRRGWESPLEETLFAASIDQATLDAMLSAAFEAFPIFRRYMKVKAKALGLERMSWYDLFAPVGLEKEWSFTEAEAFVAKHFGGYSDKMGRFAERAFRERWIDAEPRLGKRDGAYCTSLRSDESRIMMNFKPSFGSVSTLAHELGHGYHNLCLAERTALQRHTPMTLAETASIFCETIVRQAALRGVSDTEGLAILEASLQGSCQVVVDISSRYLFEKAVFEKRADRELSSRELCDLMADAQSQTYGDGLKQTELHPFMWAMKPHYYSSGRSFYNFPYMFGLLFGLGLYAQYESDPDRFRASYDDLLSSTGLASASDLALRFGIDIKGKAFWEGSLALIAKDVDRFEALIG